ncbi:hypothetical protein Bra3105_06105 [Brachybacterium halotolerans subsp. kimchii]|uniref:hypothetical protein n=1 Tax=Brachybacterium halotolerans TaxID=2795215 RepID=UPI001E64F335|nr:hypothetical protein [Brachybacterium halotolerans]UEJ83885.1 hypothetical protein Bra3105_06105 [Brachybacterium halotolerans subsp. kimchii]
MASMRERDAEWAHEVRVRIEQRVHPFFEPPVPTADDEWAQRGEESQIWAAGGDVVAERLGATV